MHIYMLMLMIMRRKLSMKIYEHLLISQPFLDSIVVLLHHDVVWEKCEIVFAMCKRYIVEKINFSR